MPARRHSNHDKLRGHPEECEAMTSAMDPTRLVPGFDFLQNLMKGGGAGLPGIGQWIAPTLEPEELQKRIDELRTVQFWLEQNAKLIGTTIQALEVQRMTLATLKGMNLQMADLADSLKLRPLTPAAPKAAPGEPEATAASQQEDAADAADARGAGAGRGAARRGAKAGAAQGEQQARPSAAVDPMQWWGALTQQFTELAAKALKDGSAEVARNLAGAAAQQGLGAAETSIERMMALSSQAAGLAAKTGSAMAGAVGAAAAPAAQAAAKARAAKASPTPGAGRAGRSGTTSSSAAAGTARVGSPRRRAA